MSEDQDSGVELYPVWRQALLKFREAGFSRDEIVPHSWFYEAFGIKMPDDSTPLKIAQKAELMRLGQFERLRAALLEQDQIDLVSEPGLGYRIIPPREQTRRAYEDGVTEIKKAVRKMRDRSVNVNTTALTADERRDHANTLARIGSLSQMFRQARALPSPDDE